MPLLEMRNIVKEFPGVRALDGVSFDLEAGEFHSIVGENGAGKSTLMKVLSGVYPYGSFDGEIAVDGSTRRFRSIRDSESAGIAIIFQELSLVKELTVGENIFLGREPSHFGVVDWNKLYRNASRLLRELGLPLDPKAMAGTLGIGQQQLVEIAKALSQEARILVLDEPTAALTESEVETLFNILEGLKRRGVGLIYISHKLDEVFRMSDRITVLRDGRTVGTHLPSGIDKDGIIAEMVGREVGDVFPAFSHELGSPALSVKGLSAFDVDDPARPVIDNISFDVKRGEVVGIAGLMGAGRTEVLTALFGAWPGRCEAEISIEGRPVSIRSPADAIRLGIGFVTEDRKRYGLILEQTIADNMTLAALRNVSGRFVTDRHREYSAVSEVMGKLRIKANSAKTVAGTLSGGNQQKVVLGKWLLTRPRVLFLDEPTRGIDVGAKQEIYNEIHELAKAGMAIVLVSSELPEVLGLSDRVLVLHAGRISAEFARGNAVPEAVMAAATGNL